MMITRIDWSDDPDEKRMKMMLALWRLWHQFQLFLVLQIRLLLNWRRLGFLRPFLAFWSIASAWDSNDWTKAGLRDGKYDIFLVGGDMLLLGDIFLFIWKWYMPSAKRNWDLPSAKRPGWKCTFASKIVLEEGLSENLVGFIGDWSCLVIWSCAEV